MMLLEIKMESVGLANKFSVVHEKDDIDLNQGSANERGKWLNKKDIFKFELQDLVRDYVSALKRWKRTPKCHCFPLFETGNVRGENEYNHCIKLLLLFFLFSFFSPLLSSYSFTFFCLPFFLPIPSFPPFLKTLTL